MEKTEQVNEEQFKPEGYDEQLDTAYEKLREEHPEMFPPLERNVNSVRPPAVEEDPEKSEQEPEKVGKKEKPKSETPDDELARIIDEEAAKSKPPVEEEPEPEQEEEEEELEPEGLPDDLFGEEKKEKKGEDENLEEEDRNPHESPNVVKRIDRAVKSAQKKWEAEQKAKEAEYEAKLAELQEKVDSAPKPEDLTDSEKDELLRLRYLHKAENSPDVQERFDKKIARNNETARGILNEFLNEDARKTLENVKDVSAWAYGNGKAFYEFIEQVQDEDPIRAERLKRAVLENQDLMSDRSTYLEEKAKDAKKYFEEQAQQETGTTKEQEKQVAERRQALEGKIKQILSHSAFKDEDIPAGVDGDARKAKESENKMRKAMRQRFANTIQLLQSDEGALRVAAENAYGAKYYARMKALEKEVETLKSQISGKRKAGPPKGGDVPSAAPKGKSTAEYKPGALVDIKSLDQDKIAEFAAEGKIVERSGRFFWA